MTTQKSGFLLGLGSNIDPFTNFPLMVHLLLNYCQPIHLSRVLNIPPVGMNSQHFFLNAVAFVETDMTQMELKHFCNQIEVDLGRDREDPDSKHKDRPADLDILCPFRLPADSEKPVNAITDEYFLFPLIEEIIAFLTDRALPSIQTGSRVSIQQLTFGETATTIYRNGNSGQERIG